MCKFKFWFGIGLMIWGSMGGLFLCPVLPREPKSLFIAIAVVIFVGIPLFILGGKLALKNDSYSNSVA